MARKERGRSGKRANKKGERDSSKTNTPEVSNRGQKQPEEKDNQKPDEGENNLAAEAPSLPNENQPDPSPSAKPAPSEVEITGNASQGAPSTSTPQSETKPKSGVSTKAKHSVPESIPFHSSGGKVTPAARPAPIVASYRSVDYRFPILPEGNFAPATSSAKETEGEGTEDLPESAGGRSRRSSSDQSTPGVFEPLRGRRVDPSFSVGPTVEVNPGTWSIPNTERIPHTPPYQRALTQSPTNRRSTPIAEAVPSRRRGFQDDPFGLYNADSDPQDRALKFTSVEKAALSRGRYIQDDPHGLYNEDSDREDFDLELTLAEKLEVALYENTYKPTQRAPSGSFVKGKDDNTFGPPLRLPQVGESSSAQASSQRAPQVHVPTTFQIESEPVIVAHVSSKIEKGAPVPTSNPGAATTDYSSKSSGNNNNQGYASKSSSTAAAPGDQENPGEDSDSEEDQTKKNPRSPIPARLVLPRQRMVLSISDDGKDEGGQGPSSYLDEALNAPQETKGERHDRIFEAPIHGYMAPRASPGLRTSRAHVYQKGDPPRYQTEPDSDEERARKELALEEQRRTANQPRGVARTAREPELEAHKQDLLRRAESARSIPNTIRVWRSYAQEDENKGKDCVRYANAAIDDALAIGTEQTKEIIEAKKEVEELKNALKDKEVDGYEIKLAQALDDVQNERHTRSFFVKKSRRFEEAARKKDQKIQSLTEQNGVIESLNEQQKREAIELTQRNQELIDMLGGPDPNLAATLQNLQKQVEDLSGENQSLRNSNDSLRADLRDCRKRKDNPQIQPSTPKTVPKTPSATGKDQHKELGDLKKKVVDLEKELSKAKNKTQSAKFKSVDEISNLQGELLEANAIAEQLNTRFAAEQSQNVDLRKSKKEIADLKRTKATLASKIIRLEQMLLDKVAEVKQLKVVIRSKLYRSIDVTGCKCCPTSTEDFIADNNRWLGWKRA